MTSKKEIENALSKAKKLEEEELLDDDELEEMDKVFKKEAKELKKDLS